MQGETTGRKVKPKDVHNMIRAKLEPYEYVGGCPNHALLFKKKAQEILPANFRGANYCRFKQ